MNNKQIIVDEIHRSARRNYKRRHVIVKGINDLFQADLVEMIPYAKVNKNFKYMLTVIDVFSKYAWAIPMKSKSAKDAVSAMEQVLKDRIPKNLQTDLGKEFYNSDFKKLMKLNNINHYCTHSNLKASVCERYNRTLKNMMWKKFSMQGTYKWITVLPSLIATICLQLPT